MQAETPGVRASAEDLWTDTLSIIPDMNPELLCVIIDFHFDATRLRVPEGIAQRLSGNPVNFVPQDRAQTPGRALHLHLKCGRGLVAFIGCEFLADRPYSHR